MESLQGFGCGRIVFRQDCTPDEFKWLSLQRLKYEDNLGRCFDWEAVTRQTRTGAARKSTCDGVAVFAKILSRSGPKRVPVVVQFRPPLDCLVIELPAGLVEPGQTVEETALRELREETGYTGQVMYITSPLSECAGITDSCCQLAVVEVDGDAAESIGARPSPEAGELLRCELLPYDGLLESLMHLRERCGASHDSSGTSCIIDSRLFALALGLQMSRPSDIHGGAASSSSGTVGEMGASEGTAATEAVYSTSSVQDIEHSCAATSARNGNTRGIPSMQHIGSTGCPASQLDVATGSRSYTFHNGGDMVLEGGASNRVSPTTAGGPMEWLDSFLEQLTGLSEGEVQAILTDRDPDDLDVAALAPLHSLHHGLNEDELLQPAIENRIDTATGRSNETYFTQAGSSTHQLQQTSEGNRECTLENRRRSGRRRRGGQQQSQGRSAVGQQGNSGPADLPVSMAVKRRGRSTVGGGGPKGFAATNAKLVYRRHVHQKGRQCAAFGLVAAMRSTRNLFNASGWVSWAASDPVATACTVVVCSVALSAGVLTFKAWLHRNR
ncbi:hypothetical protein Vretimale_11651 [Volvox reticuliferus]|uniref:Nudix hydrolase domain-containing protein n=1 Tax=Volvox reticuliferus TaxID=1737510 RepID=A0A8J4GI44_9CHLO|nr:hypothetical protein Vretifemale_14760 [Volvox reticuliferus]GIM07562.1 hypothetical protein Vretimale_11651 [Volvox reticuliferus]